MPRKSLPPAPPVDDNTNMTAVDSAHEAASELGKRLAMIDQIYGDGQHYELHRVEREVKFYEAQTGQGILEIGKRFMLIKEHEPHGEFLESLNRLGYEPRSAQNFMRVALKFCSPNAKTFSHLGSSKLIALATLDDEEIEELEEGGTVAGLQLDQIDRMSVRDLKQALRKEKDARKKEAEVQERMLADKNNKIDELDKKLRAATDPSIPTSEQAHQILGNLRTQTGAALQAMNRMDQQMTCVVNGEFSPDESVAVIKQVTREAYALVNAVLRRSNELMDIAEMHFLPVVNEPRSNHDLERTDDVLSRLDAALADTSGGTLQ